MKNTFDQPLFIFAAFFLISLLFPDAMVHAKHEKNETRPWQGEISSGLIFDNNILLVKTDKESDVIWESGLFLAYKPKEISWHTLAIYDRYLSNSELSYSYYEIGGQVALGAYQYGGFSLNFSPTSLLDKQDPNRDLLSLGSYGFNLFAEHDTEHIGTIALNISYTRLDYSAPFDAKDSDLITLSPSLFYRITDVWDFFGEYGYSSGRARRGLIPVGFNQSAFDDISYKAHLLSLMFTHWMPEQTRLRFRYTIRKKDFITGDADTFHQGRTDRTHLLSAEIKRRVLENISIRAQVKGLWKRSNQAFVDFSGNKITLSATYQF